MAVSSTTGGPISKGHDRHHPVVVGHQGSHCQPHPEAHDVGAPASKNRLRNLNQTGRV